MTRVGWQVETGRWYVLSALLAAYILSHADRQILNLLVTPIKRDLALDDVRVSLLQGFSFAVVMTLAALPVARLVDRSRRVTVLGSAIAIWSLATMACGLAAGFTSLLGARMLVGIGEAAMLPAAYSLIGDLFDRRQMGRAVSVFSLGSYAGSGLALLFGAAAIGLAPTGLTSLPLIGAIHGWQLTFLVVGAPGLLVAAWIAMLREPARGRRGEQVDHSLVAMRDWFGRHGSAVLRLNLGTGFTSMGAYALMAWLPSLLGRRFGWSSHAAGSALGVILLTGGLAGATIAALIGDRRIKIGHAAGRLPVLIAAVAAALVLFAAALAMPRADAMLVLLLPAFVALACALSTGPAILQDITPPGLRGMQHAIAGLAATLIGLGLGPTIVALLTDHVFADERMLGWSLLLACPIMFGVALMSFLAALAPYRVSLAESSLPLRVAHPSPKP